MRYSSHTINASTKTTYSNRRRRGKEMTGKHICNCRWCGSVLTIERLIGPKVGTELDVCLQCLITAFEEVLRETESNQKILAPLEPSPSQKQLDGGDER
jgi:hypothetical protein